MGSGEGYLLGGVTERSLITCEVTGCANNFAQMLKHAGCKKHASTWPSFTKILSWYIVTAGILQFIFHYRGPSVRMIFMFCKLEYQCNFFCTPYYSRTGGQERKTSKSDFVMDITTDGPTDGPTKWLIESRVRD